MLINIVRASRGIWDVIMSHKVNLLKEDQQDITTGAEG